MARTGPVLVGFEAGLSPGMKVPRPFRATFCAHDAGVARDRRLVLKCQTNDMINGIKLMNCCVSSLLQCFVREKREQIDGFHVIKCTSAIALI